MAQTVGLGEEPRLKFQTEVTATFSLTGRLAI